MGEAMRTLLGRVDPALVHERLERALEVSP
jgi:hypothetical protein